MENVTVDAWVRVRPPALCSPVAPEGMVTVSLDEGTKGLVGWKTSVVGVISCHVPATGGERVGIGVVEASGVERLTVIVLSDATLVAPAAGVVLTTVSGALLTAVVLAGVAEGEASAVLADNRTIKVDAPAIRSTATPTRAITRAGRRLAGRRCPRGLCGRGVVPGIMLSVRRHVSS
jgi:hypothetical protein